MCALPLLVLVACVWFTRAEASCASCERAHEEEGELLEAAKRHILARLQLHARPNITHSLPRAAMLPALRRLHAAVLQDGRVELPPERRVEDSAEIISFAERDDMVRSRSGLFFLVSNEGNQTLFVSQASLWLYLRLLPRKINHQTSDQTSDRTSGRTFDRPTDRPRRPRRVVVKLYHQAPGFGSEWHLMERRLELKRSGWHSFDLTGALRWLLQSGQRRQNLDVRCDGCESEKVVPVLFDPDDNCNEDSHRPNEDSGRSNKPSENYHRPNKGSHTLIKDSHRSNRDSRSLNEDAHRQKEDSHRSNEDFHKPNTDSQKPNMDSTRPNELPLRPNEASHGPNEDSLRPNVDSHSTNESNQDSYRPKGPNKDSLKPNKDSQKPNKDSHGSKRDPSCQNDAPHRPFLVLRVRREEGMHRIRKRGLECDGSSGLCCRQQFYIDFRLIGWSDWIIAPSGYYANYCEGRCPGHMAGVPSAVSSFHTVVLNQYRLRGLAPKSSSCCIPTALSSMSMLYFDHEFNIVKRDVPNMIVDECGCA